MKMIQWSLFTMPGELLQRTGRWRLRIGDCIGEVSIPRPTVAPDDDDWDLIQRRIPRRTRPVGCQKVDCARSGWILLAAEFQPQKCPRTPVIVADVLAGRENDDGHIGRRRKYPVEGCLHIVPRHDKWDRPRKAGDEEEVLIKGCPARPGEVAQREHVVGDEQDDDWAPRAYGETQGKKTEEAGSSEGRLGAANDGKVVSAEEIEDGFI